jgi:hypothetical protein
LQSPLNPRPRPSWKTELSTAQFGTFAEDLLGVALAASANGSGTVARPAIDRGVDLYLRRLRTLLTVPFQVKAFRHVDVDGVGTMDIAKTDIREGLGGYWAMVHVPSPHDQLYSRLFLVPQDELRKVCRRVASHGVDSYRFSANFASTNEDPLAPFAVDVERLDEWIARIPGWTERTPSVLVAETVKVREAFDDLGTVGLSSLATLWAKYELERAGNGAIMVAEDRSRLDTVTLLAHQPANGRFAGLHVRTAIFDETRRTHFEVKRPHFFADPNLWVLLVLMRPDRRVHDFCLLIPSKDIPDLGFSETVTLDPLTRRFRRYQLASTEFGQTFCKAALNTSAARPVRDGGIHLPMAG